MDPVIEEAFKRRLAQGPLYFAWVFDPQSGEVELFNPDESTFGIPSHEEMAQKYPHPERLHGYAYRISNGWRITDWEHAELGDPFVALSVQQALAGQ